jgi:hypothetical protein
VRIDIKKHIISVYETHKEMGDPVTAYDLAELAENIQKKNIENLKSVDNDLIFVGFTNGAQILYANDSEGEGSFYRTSEHNCIIPLYMLGCHVNRIETTTDGSVNLGMIIEARSSISNQPNGSSEE